MKKLLTCLEKKGLEKEDLAEMINVSVEAVRRYLKGERHPRRDIGKKILHLFPEMTWADLNDDGPDIYPPSSRSIATKTLPRHKEKAGAVARRTPASVSAKGGL